MKSLLLLLAAIAALACGTAFGQTASNEHGIPDGPTLLTNVPTTSTGTLLKKRLRWTSSIPLNKSYEQLSPEQKAEFRALYVALPDADEPPYPLQGLKPLFNAIQKGQDIMQ